MVSFTSKKRTLCVMVALAILAISLGSSWRTEQPAHVEPDAEEALALSDDVHAEESDFPNALSELGVFSNLPTLSPAGGVVAFDVNFPLFSDQTAKHRHLRVPRGAGVVRSEQGEPVFPTGTLLLKTFSYPDGIGRIETRVSRRTKTKWIYATYMWRPDQTDADLVRAMGLDTLIPIPESNLTYAIPSRTSCIQCHGVGGAPLGFSRWQLTDATAKKLETLMTGDQLPLARESIQGRTAAESHALEHFIANCVFCHQPGTTASAGNDLDLRPRHAVESLVNVRSRRLSLPDASMRVAPKDPDASLIYRLTARTYSSGNDRQVAMPPIGSRLVDDEGVRVIRDWILELSTDERGLISR